MSPCRVSLCLHREDLRYFLQLEDFFFFSYREVMPTHTEILQCPIEFSVVERDKDQQFCCTSELYVHVCVCERERGRVRKRAQSKS